MSGRVSCLHCVKVSLGEIVSAKSPLKVMAHCIQNVVTSWMGERWMAVFTGVIVAATGDDAELKTFKSKMESGKKKLGQQSEITFLIAQKVRLHLNISVR